MSNVSFTCNVPEQCLPLLAALLIVTKWESTLTRKRADGESTLHVGQSCAPLCQLCRQEMELALVAARPSQKGLQCSA
jgi:hypothetical protein